MKKYAKIENEDVKICLVGLGTDAEFYKSMGMALHDVEQDWRGCWYLTGFAPEKPESIKAAEEIAELKQKLADSDYAIVKIAEGAATQAEYAELIEQRAQWRARINELEAAIG